MAKTFKIFWYDKEIKNFVNKKCIGKVLSVYKDYINVLFNQNRVITIVKDNLTNLPQGHCRLVINKKKFFNNDFNKTIFPNDKVLLNDKKIEIGNTNKTIFLLPRNAVNNCLKKNSIKKIAVDRELLLRFLKYINFCKPGIDKKILFLTNKFVGGLRIGDKKKLAIMIKKYIGLGQGSTPEFDDFLCGVLTSFYVFDRIKSLSQKYKKIYKLIKLVILKSCHKTTLLSYNFILQICEEKFSLRVIKLIENLLEKKISYLTKVINLILSEGKNSGWWFLYGFFTTSLLLAQKGQLK